MELNVISNPDITQTIAYKIARVIYAETYAPTLPAVEAMASMISNIAKQSNRDVADVIKDENIFSSLNPKSPRHKYISVDASDRAFQMCVRVVKRMLRGVLPDMCSGATRFHRADELPEWAFARGYIADIDGLLFYVMGA